MRPRSTVPFRKQGPLETLPAKTCHYDNYRGTRKAFEMERPSGPPLGAATQSTGRPMGENGIARPAPLNTARKVSNNSNPTIQHAASSSSISAQIPISAGQVVALAREAMKVALEENQTKAAETSGVSNELKPGVTIDLSHKNIQKFPDEVVDIIKNELERYAFSILSYL